MDNVNELRERTNPVFNTAKTTLYTLALAGDKDAAVFAERLGFTDDKMSGSNEQKALTKANIAIMEARYRTMNNFIKDSGKKTVFDIPCGYTPRALYMVSKGNKYIGCDLPAVIDEVGSVAKDFFTQNGVSGAEYKSVDATNYLSLRTALDGVSGELCISTEGLLMYLNQPELDSLCDNIRLVLNEFGGCWITPDPESLNFAISTMSALLGQEALKALSASKETFSKKADIEMSGNCMILTQKDDPDRVKNYLSSRGLKAERVPMSSKMPELNSIADVPEEKKNTLKAAYDNIGVWIITADKNVAVVTPNKQESKKFSADTKLLGDTLSIILKGRVDSLTAPQLLEAYETAAVGKTVNRVSVDCEKLEYISSAGLRVLMIMAKQHPQNVWLVNVIPDVKAVLEQTGFDQIVTCVLRSKFRRWSPKKIIR